MDIEAPANQLVRYDEMCRAIGAAYEVDEVKQIRDKAVALEHYFRVAKNPEPERRACEIRLRAERKAGELRKMEEKVKGRPKSGSAGGPLLTNPERRKQLGISRKQDKNWQELAGVPQEQFEEALAGPDKPTTTGILNEAKPPKPKVTPVADECLWLCGRLEDFERDGLLARDPNEVIKTAIPTMRSQILRLAPLVAAWLERVEDV